MQPWITRDEHGRWTGRDYPTAEAARDAEPDTEVWADNFLVGAREFAPSPHVANSVHDPVEPAWRREVPAVSALGLDLRATKPPTG